MTTTATKTIVSGTPLWRKIIAGPKGGKSTWYAPRREGETEPSPWVFWSRRARDVSEGDVVLAHGI